MARRFARTPAPQPDLKWAMTKVRQLGLAPFARLRASMPTDYSGARYGQWIKRQAEVTRDVAIRLTAEGASVIEDGHLTRFTFAGIKATSTMGLAGALRNWRQAAEKKLDQQAGRRS